MKYKEFKTIQGPLFSFMAFTLEEREGAATL
jgi:hypothetical protein